MEVQASGSDRLKLAFAILVAAAGVASFYYFAAQPVWARWLGLLVMAGIAVSIALTSEHGRVAWRFMQTSRTELRKVVWPTRTETVQTTAAVLVIVVIVGIFLWLLDMFLLWGTQALTGQGG